MVIQRILSGDKNAYSILVQRYNQRLYRIAFSVLNNEAEVEDALQVAYINAYEKLSGYRFQSSFIKSILKTTLQNFYKREDIFHLHLRGATK